MINSETSLPLLILMTKQIIICLIYPNMKLINTGKMLVENMESYCEL